MVLVSSSGFLEVLLVVVLWILRCSAVVRVVVLGDFSRFCRFWWWFLLVLVSCKSVGSEMFLWSF